MSSGLGVELEAKVVMAGDLERHTMVANLQRGGLDNLLDVVHLESILHGSAGCLEQAKPTRGAKPTLVS